MGTKIIKLDVAEIVKKELNLSYEHFPAFNSAHEGYAVLLEEVEELQDEVKFITGEMSTWWDVVKRNDIDCNDFMLNGIEESAIKAACEAIQVAAMCQKFRKSLLEQEG